MTTEARALFLDYLRQRGDLGETELVLDPATIDALYEVPQARLVANQPEFEPCASAVALPQPSISRVQVSASGPAVADPQPPVQIGSFAELARTAGTCTACGLATTRSTVVFGEGSTTAELVVVGEAPGAEEDRTGRPFVGRAGKLLDTLLASIGYPRQSVYICNVLKCRPPGNRNPAPVEVEACSPFLKRQLELIGPKAILACGTFPAQTLLGTTEPIGRLRGAVHEYDGIPFVPTYHPAALLRNPAWIRPVWEDLQRLRAALDR